MKKGVIFALILLLFSSIVYADDFNLQVSVDKKEVTLTWNNIFYEEESDSDSEGNAPGEPPGVTNHLECLGNMCTKVEGVGENGCETEGQQCGLPPNHLECLGNMCTKVEGEGENGCETENEACGLIYPACETNEGCNEGEECVENTCKAAGTGGTGGAVYSITGASFLSNIFEKITHFFKSLFGVKPVGKLIGNEKYIINKYDIGGAEIPIGEIHALSCDQQCIYTYTEPVDGTYSYSVLPIGGSGNNEMSDRIGPIEILIVEVPVSPITTNNTTNNTTENQPECVSNEDCSDDKSCIDGVCIETIVPDNEPEVECTSNEDCGSGEACTENVCVCIIGSENTRLCTFDLGICQKPGTQARTCIAGVSGNLVWGDFGYCEIEPECNTGAECESNLCDLDIHSCLPSNFEDAETSCEDGLDNDCDGDSDCDDEDCNLDDYCIVDISESETGETEPPTSGESNENAGSSSSGSRTPGVAGGETSYQTPQKSGLSLTTWMIILIILLIIGVVLIYFYVFKFKK